MRSTTVTTMTLRKLQKKNCKIVTFLKPIGKSSTCDCFLFYFCLVLFEIGDPFAVPAQRAGGEQAIVRGLYHVGTAGGKGGYRDEAGLCAYLISAEQVQPVELVCGYETLDFIEEGQRVKWAQFRFQTVCNEPYRMPVS